MAGTGAETMEEDKFGPAGCDTRTLSGLTLTAGLLKGGFMAVGGFMAARGVAAAGETEMPRVGEVWGTMMSPGVGLMTELAGRWVKGVAVSRTEATEGTCIMKEGQAAGSARVEVLWG